jgi:hypothetical protein
MSEATDNRVNIACSSVTLRLGGLEKHAFHARKHMPGIRMETCLSELIYRMNAGFQNAGCNNNLKKNPLSLGMAAEPSERIPCHNDKGTQSRTVRTIS